MPVMMQLELPVRKGSPLKILCLGAHSDDLEIGCGGTILKLLGENENIHMHWTVFSAWNTRSDEAKAGAEKFLAGAAQTEIELEKFRDGFFPYEGGEIKAYFEELKGRVNPDLIFTHCRHDLHQDHRLVNELTWNTFRDHMILEYEIPKYDGDIGNPNVFVHLDEETCRRKIAYIIESFRSQGTRAWFTQDVFLALLRLRGLESNSPHRYAEGFYCRKTVLS
jgi:LmbE family N-acetylglucosaminyl deacetylase